MIPYSRQTVNKADIDAVVKVLRSKWLTQGPAIEQFEKAIAKEVGTNFAVAFSSGTAALHAAYFAGGIGKGDEVIVPALTFAATANAALYLDAVPVFADVDLIHGIIDIKDVEKKITKKTKAIVPVDYAGHPADLDEFRILARKHKLLFIEDAAHSLGAKYHGKPVGTQADMTMFSFHPVKSITTGEGGVIVTNNEDFFKKLLLFRSHGIQKKKLWHQEMRFLGYNYRITDIQAALGESQLKRLQQFIRKRRFAAQRYKRLLENIPGIIIPPKEHLSKKASAWHLYPILLQRFEDKDKIFNSLREAGIGVQVHYPPVYLHPYYRKLGYKKGICPNAEQFYKSELSIPIFVDITEKQQKFVADTLKNILVSL